MGENSLSNLALIIHSLTLIICRLTTVAACKTVALLGFQTDNSFVDYMPFFDHTKWYKLMTSLLTHVKRNDKKTTESICQCFGTDK